MTGLQLISDLLIDIVFPLCDCKDIGVGFAVCKIRKTNFESATKHRNLQVLVYTYIYISKATGLFHAGLVY